jgi:hypothetical protein
LSERSFDLPEVADTAGAAGRGDDSIMEPKKLCEREIPHARRR